METEVQRKRDRRNTVTGKLGHSVEAGINHLALTLQAQYIFQQCLYIKKYAVCLHSGLFCSTFLHAGKKRI